MRIIGRLTRQYNTGPWIGGAKDLASRTMMYVSFINFALVAITAYNTTLKESLPWLNLIMYFAVLIFLVMLFMFIEYKFIVPSHYTFLNKQEYEHRNLIREDLKEIKEVQENILKRLNELEDTSGSRNNSTNKPS